MIHWKKQKANEEKEMRNGEEINWRGVGFYTAILPMENLNNIILHFLAVTFNLSVGNE